MNIKACSWNQYQPPMTPTNYYYYGPIYPRATVPERQEHHTTGLDQITSMIFWAISAEKGLSYTFAEVQVPISPPYMMLDHQYHSWWKSKGRPPIPQGYAIKVYKAIQWYPESPRLWAILVLRSLLTLVSKHVSTNLVYAIVKSTRARKFILYDKYMTSLSVVWCQIWLIVSSTK